ncbi:MAG: MBL fold metallo-hydrolase, partial [Thermodesulfobacteria bacterium]|nr:MBL fold metallo-hydrolase [Thermodesulfobacteriota bacterium]
DHLDLTALKKIAGPKKIITPLGFSHYLATPDLVELDWFESFEESGVRFTALPLQHWSKRKIADTNCSLWAGFMVEAEGLRIFLSGDTGYFFGFEEMGELFGPFDLALLPAGAFLPRRLMAPFHLSPEEAVRAAQELKARQATPIHWGAYKLGDEALDDPPKLFKKAAREEGLKPLILYPGEAALWHRGAFRPVEQIPS